MSLTTLGSIMVTLGDPKRPGLWARIVEVRVVRPWWRFLMPHPGLTLGKRTIRIRPALITTTLLGHEAVHVWQAWRLGWKYLPIYLWQALHALVTGTTNSMELQALGEQAAVAAGTSYLVRIQPLAPQGAPASLIPHPAG